MVHIIIAVVITAVVAIGLTYVASNAHFKKVSDEKIGSAEDRARAIIDEAVKAAETKKREALLEVKEESIKTKNELDKEIKDRRSEIQRNERRVEQKEFNLDKNWKPSNVVNRVLQQKRKKSSDRKQKLPS